MSNNDGFNSSTPFAGVKSVAKALSILNAFDLRHLRYEYPISPRGLGIPKSTVHGLLQTLQQAGFVMHDDEDETYTPWGRGCCNSASLCTATR